MENRTIENCLENGAKYAKIGVNNNPYCTFEDGCESASDKAYISVDGKLKPVCRKAYEVRKLQNYKK